jgi:hypothetical protein
VKAHNLKIMPKKKPVVSVKIEAPSSQPVIKDVVSTFMEEQLAKLHPPPVPVTDESAISSSSRLVPSEPKSAATMKPELQSPSWTALSAQPQLAPTPDVGLWPPLSGSFPTSAGPPSTYAPSAPTGLNIHPNNQVAFHLFQVRQQLETNFLAKRNNAAMARAASQAAALEEAAALKELNDNQAHDQFAMSASNDASSSSSSSTRRSSFSAATLETPVHHNSRVRAVTLDLTRTEHQRERSRSPDSSKDKKRRGRSKSPASRKDKKRRRSRGARSNRHRSKSSRKRAKKREASPVTPKKSKKAKMTKAEQQRRKGLMSPRQRVVYDNKKSKEAKLAW